MQRAGAPIEGSEALLRSPVHTFHKNEFSS